MRTAVPNGWHALIESSAFRRPENHPLSPHENIPPASEPTISMAMTRTSEDRSPVIGRARQRHCRGQLGNGSHDEQYWIYNRQDDTATESNPRFARPNGHGTDDEEAESWL